jgi:hypothetical protein
MANQGLWHYNRTIPQAFESTTVGGEVWQYNGVAADVASIVLEETAPSLSGEAHVVPPFANQATTQEYREMYNLFDPAMVHQAAAPEYQRIDYFFDLEDDSVPNHPYQADAPIMHQWSNMSPPGKTPWANCGRTMVLT